MTSDQMRQGNLRLPQNESSAAIGLALLAWFEYGVIGFPLTEEEKRCNGKRRT
jgi:hypothetical protein